MRQVIVIGAGLAGLSSAIHLLDHNIKPVVLEALPFVGGRTSSWSEQGMQIESGLHRFLGFYTHLPRLLKKAGINMDEMLVWEDEIEIRSPDGLAATFGLSPLHKPLKTAWRLLSNNEFLSPKDKLLLEKFFIAGSKDYVTRPEYLDSMTVLQYAQKHRVSKNAIERLLIPLTEGIFFLPIASYSAYVLFGLFIPYWKSLHKLRVGAFRGGMTEVMSQPLAEYIQKRGGTVLSNTQVTRITKTKKRFTVYSSSRSYEADAVILATSLFPAQEILRTSFPQHSGDFNNMLRLQTMPSVTFQIELKKPALKIDRTTFGPLTSMAAFAEQSRTTFSESNGRLSIILSPPEAFMYMDEEAILGHVIEDAKRLGIHFKSKVLSYRKVVIPHDFYLLAPGAEKLRPPSKTAVGGLFLAGDYTRQQYLATMEGAVFSGKTAAQLTYKYLNPGVAK